MTKLELHYPLGATPLDPDEMADLIPKYLTTRGELNELEHKNIQRAVLWVRGRRAFEVTDPGFVYELHKQMFSQVWKWAGRARRSGKNIGVDWHQIATHTAQLLADTRYWIDQKTYPVDEIAARFHHGLVKIHVFPNGNGRHARLIADLLLEWRGHERFSWGEKTVRAPLEAESERRRDYINALQAADKNDYGPLLDFVRS